ncbi:MAG: hypothetical protein LBG30_07395, partial [Odoribacteraceae bacterium]|nr:hypothetical protein [Odoribacteraceae bacterium]
MNNDLEILAKGETPARKPDARALAPDSLAGNWVERGRTGIPGAVTGIPGTVTGIPGTVTGIPGTVTGNPGTVTGIPGTDKRESR